MNIMEKINKFLDTPLLDFADTTVTVGQVIGVVAFVVLGALFLLWSSRFLDRYLQKRVKSQDLHQMVRRAFLIVGFTVLGLVTLDLLRIPLTAFAFISGAIAIGVGFGAQNIINNFISGWILMWERPIKIGDFLEMGELRGKVESINTRSTRIRRLDGVDVLIPNSFLLENSVINWTHKSHVVRTSVVVGVAYGSDVQQVTILLEKAADEYEGVLKEPERAVVFDAFGDSALIFELLFWANLSGERGLRTMRSDLRYRIDALFRENDITISFPQRDIHVDGSISIRNS
jgi:small-conductance mechanosensitive channel